MSQRERQLNIFADAERRIALAHQEWAAAQKALPQNKKKREKRERKERKEREKSRQKRLQKKRFEQVPHTSVRASVLLV